MRACTEDAARKALDLLARARDDANVPPEKQRAAVATLNAYIKALERESSGSPRGT